MKEQQASYYQFQQELGYQVYIRFEEAKIENEMAQLLDFFGFSKVETKALKDISFKKLETKVLKISEASPRVAKQLRQFSSGMESFGSESLSSHGDYQIYRYQNVGMMVFGEGSPTWEMGLIKVAENHEAVKVMLVRFLSWALASKGVVGFWSVPVEQGFVVMKPKEADYEAVFVDIEKMVLITNDGVKKISADLQILRLDETLKNVTKGMNKEALLSFLTTNTCHFSYHGVTSAMRRSLFEIASFAQGVVYPVENFRPRSDLRAD